MIQQKVSEDELAKVKNKIEAYTVFSEVNILNRAMSLAYYEMLGDANDVNRQIEKFAAVTAADLQNAAAKIFRKENSNTIRYFSKN
jgi:zinc protease